MTSDLMLPGKWTVRAHGRRLVLVKKPNEKSAHVIMKALLWALYLPRYPQLTVEVGLGLRYKPDLVATDEREWPVFWAEAGQVGVEKIRTLCRRYRDTHLVVAKWDVSLDSWREILDEAVAQVPRRAPVDLIRFPADSRERFVSRRGEIVVGFESLERISWGGS